MIIPRWSNNFVGEHLVFQSRCEARRPFSLSSLSLSFGAYLVTCVVTSVNALIHEPAREWLFVLLFIFTGTLSLGWQVRRGAPAEGPRAAPSGRARSRRG